MVREDGSIKTVMGHKLDILNLGKTRNQVVDAFPFSDHGRMKRNIEDKTSLPLERRGIPTRDVVLLENQGLKTLSGKSRRTTQPAEPGPDDHGIILILLGVSPLSSG